MIEDIVSYILAVILCIWYVLSVIKYIPNTENWIVNFDAFLLIPQWNFFAPDPNQSDYYLYLRTYTNENPSPWRLINIAGGRKWFCFIWNPERRNRKAFFDLCQSMITQKESPRASVILSLPYLILLNYVWANSRNQLGDKFQYAIGAQVLNMSQDDLHVIFISEVHTH